MFTRLKNNNNKLIKISSFLKNSESEVSNIWGHFNSPSEPLRANETLFKQLGNWTLTTGKSLLWEFLEMQVWLKNKQSLKLKWKKTAISQQIGQFRNCTVASNTPKWESVVVSLQDLFLSVLNRVFFFTSMETKPGIFVVSWKTERIFSIAVLLVQVVYGGVLLCELFSVVFWVMFVTCEMERPQKRPMMVG